MEPIAIEVEALIESVRMRYGLDLREHPRPPLRRRLLEFGAEEGLTCLSELQGRVLRDPGCFERLAQRTSVIAAALFRDPSFYVHLRQDVFPVLRTWPTIHAWVAGCATGEDACSLVIALSEEGLLGRTRIFATDRNRAALEAARTARYPLSAMEAQASNYTLAGGRSALSDHYAVMGDTVAFHPQLFRNVTYAVHDLTTDARFGEFQLISCRNVLSQHGEQERRRIVRVLDESLVPFGILALDSSEPVPADTILRRYEQLGPHWRTLRRVP